jgi:hypothetical protein
VAKQPWNLPPSLSNGYILEEKNAIPQVSLIWIWTLNGKDHNNYPFVKPTTVNHVRAEVLVLNDIKWFEMYCHRDQKTNKSW